MELKGRTMDEEDEIVLKLKLDFSAKFSLVCKACGNSGLRGPVELDLVRGKQNEDWGDIQAECKIRCIACDNSCDLAL